jgi:hypothetical protein
MEQLEYLMQYEWVRTAIIVMIISRIVFKSLFTILGKYVELTVEVEDDKKLAKIMDSKWYKLAAFVVDMTLSVKLPKRK